MAGAPAAATVEFSLGSSADVWLWSGKIAVVLVLAVFVLLAWSRAIAWWLPALPVVGIALNALAPLPVPVELALTIASLAPAYVAAHQLITGRRRAT